MDVSLSRDTYASTCSPDSAMATTRSAIASSSSVPAEVWMAVGADPSGCRSTDGEGLDPERRLTVADGHALAILAARARVAHGEVIAEQVDVAQHLRAVADQVAVAQRLGDLPVLDEVRLSHAEHKVTGRGVHAAAAEVGDVHAVVGTAHDVGGILRAVEHVGVGHPHHRQVHVALPPPVAARPAAFLARAD